MATLKEKITFILTALAYLLFHLRLGASAGEVLSGTFYQMLLTAPYAIGFTYVIAFMLRKLSGGGWPSWDRLCRIFFTLGILFAFFFALYEYAGGDVTEPGEQSSVSRTSLNDARLPPWYWA